MGYEYDSKVNKDLAKTAMSIYTKAHNIKPEPINESKEVINEEALRENINSLILNYVSDVIILAEQELGREMTDVEINEASIELLNRINSISDEDKTAFVTELAEAAGPSMTQAPGVSQAPAGEATAVKGGRPGAAARPSGLGTAPGAATKPNLGFRPTRGQESGEFDAANYSPANYATASEALAAMFAAGFSSGQQIAMVLGQNWGGPSMTDGTVS
tara:strand:- start:45 stop:695 length:651 start_codon:yes stop_codon:yes gene_type:complete